MNINNYIQYDLIIKWGAFLSVSLLVLWYYKVVLGGEYNYNDDLLTLTQVKELSVLEIFRSTIIDSTYYRPMIQLIIKASESLFADYAYPIRLIQVVLHVITLMLFFQIGKALSLKDAAIYIGLLALCFSPFTYIGIAKFGIEVGSYLLGVLFLLSFLLIIKEKVSLFLAVVITIIAFLTREQGLLIAFTFFLYFLFGKRVLSCSVMILLVGGYLLLHSVVVGDRAVSGFTGSTGWFFEFLTVPELNEKFGDSHYILYIYNVVAHFFSLFIYLPIKGQIILSDIHTLLFVGLSLFTSLVIVIYLWKKSNVNNLNVNILLLVSLANVLIGYSYCRHRMLFIAGLAVSILLSYATHTLLVNVKEKKIIYTPVFLLLFCWGVAGVLQVNKLDGKFEKAIAHYKNNTVAKEGVDKSLYNDLRGRLIN